MKLSRATVLAFLLGSTLMTSVNAQESIPLDSIVAVVNEDVILRSDLDQAVQSVIARVRSQGQTLPPQDLVEKQVLDNLILSKLEVQRALETGVRASDADIDAALIAVAQQNNMTVAQLRSTIESDGFDFGEFRRSMGEDILSQRLRQRVTESMVNISETEIDILLASEDLIGGEYDLAHILITVPDGATPQQIADAEEEAHDIWRRLENGLEFSSAAISYSNSPEALEGGDLGWRDLNTIPRNLADAIKDLPAGEYTPVVRSIAGFHIVKVKDRRDNTLVMVSEQHARHILVLNSELLNARQAMERITHVAQLIKDGEDFAELAKEYSDDPTTANIGGDLGWFQRGTYDERFHNTIDGLAVNEISEPFQTDYGWHIIQYLGEREMDRTNDAIRMEARNKIFQRKAEIEVQQFLREMRDESYVENRLTGE